MSTISHWKPIFPPREDRHVPRVLQTAGEHHTRLPRLPDTGQCDGGDMLGILFPESKTNYNSTTSPFNNLTCVVVSEKGQVPTLGCRPSALGAQVGGLRAVQQT